MAELARDELVANLKSLLSSGDYSDLVITCGNDAYNVHKSVVCSQSGFFKRAERFAVGKEAAKNKIDLPDDDPAIIDALIRFLYEGDYEPTSPRMPTGYVPLIMPVDTAYNHRFPHTCEGHPLVCAYPKHEICPHHNCSQYSCGSNCRGFICKECTGFESHDDPSDLLLHARIYEVADKYDIAGLKMLAREKFRRACIVYWDHDSFPAALEHALSSTPDEDQGLRDILSDTILAHPPLLEQGNLEDIINEHRGFMYEVLKRHSAELKRLRSDVSAAYS